MRAGATVLKKWSALLLKCSTIICVAVSVLPRARHVSQLMPSTVGCRRKHTEQDGPRAGCKIWRAHLFCDPLPEHQSSHSPFPDFRTSSHDHCGTPLVLW